MMYPYYGTGGAGWGAAVVMMLFGLLVLVGIILLIVWAVRQGQHGHGPYYQQHAPGAGTPPTHQQWGPGGFSGVPMQERQPGQPAPGTPYRDPVLDLVRERYARGEITKEQYDEMLRTLGYQPQPTPSATEPQQQPPAGG